MTTFGMKATPALALLATGAIVALAACTPMPGSDQPSSPASASPATATAGPAPTPEAPGKGSATASSTIGALVEGFPSGLLPLMPGATVISSSFDKSSTPANAALVASIPGPPAPVMEFYTGIFEAQGFQAVPGEAVGGVASKDFVRGTNEIISLTVVEVAGTSTINLGANVAPESAK